MQCSVFQSRRKRDTFLSLPTKDDFSHLSPGLMKVFARPQFALEFELATATQACGRRCHPLLANLAGTELSRRMPSANDLPA